MTPRATGGSSEHVTEAEVLKMISNALIEYDDRTSKPRHMENQQVQQRTLQLVTEVRDKVIAGQAVTDDRNKQGDHRRDWLAPILAALLAAAAGAILTLIFAKPLRSGVRDMLSSTPSSQTAQSADSFHLRQ